MKYCIALIVLLLVFSFFPVQAALRLDGQDQELRTELDFILHLITREDYDASLYLLERIGDAGRDWSDSLNFLSGWVMYRQKNLELSANKLLKVGKESPVFYKSHFFGAYNLAHIGQHQEAQKVLYNIPVASGSMHEALRCLQLSGLALLQNDLDEYFKYSMSFVGEHHVMVEQERNMESHRRRLEEARTPSPLVAGMLSAAVPGLGRIYAGKTSEGIISFLYVAALGFTSYDFYRGGGAKSPMFIISAGVTGLFYAGNIAGSAVAVRRKNQEFRYEMEQRILFDMHIPLRNAFN